MTTQSASHLPRATTHRSRRFSIIWLIPLAAVAIGAWLAYDTISKEGPTVRVTFESGEGLQAGQSQLKYKDIVFGTVKSLSLTPDNSHVVATIATTREAKSLFNDKTIFWVVKPRLFAGNISGLDTVLSGSYVSLVPGNSNVQKLDFVGQEDPPILQTNVPGHIFRLKSPRIGSITVGSPIFFRDFNVGQVLGWDIGDMADSVIIQAFIRAPYDAYVHDETRFWNASGISVSLGAQGVQVKMESLRALLFGGIAFDTPGGDGQSAIAAENHEFPLFADREAANSSSYTRVIHAVSYFSGSARGLAAGSDVTMHGLKIGEVTHVRLIVRGEAPRREVLTKVRYGLQPERIAGLDEILEKMNDTEAVNTMLARGLRASLETASLITGQQAVSLDLVPNAPAASLTMDGNRFVLPTMEGAGGFAGLAASATDLINKINTMPFAQIGTNLNNVLESVNKATSGLELKTAVDNMASALATAQRTLVSVNKLAGSLDTGYGNDTKFSRDLDRLLVQTDDAVRSVRALADLMSQHPEALIKGRKE